MSDKFISSGSKDKVWFTFHQTYDAISRYEDYMFSRFNITLQQFMVIATIKRLKAPVTQKMVAKSLERHRYSVSSIIDRMEKDGLVKRGKNLHDRRSLNLLITSKGEEAFQNASGPTRNIHRQVLSVLSHEDLIAFEKALNVIKERAKELRNSA